MADNKNLSIETLRKMSFENIDQFTEDLNRNFAVIQNSPLFKGIPGKKGNPGDGGLRGVRGSNFIFVKFDKFIEVFPGETQMSSQINLDYLNSKLLTFDEKQKLLKALGVTELVNNDVIVLTNSAMLSYDGINDVFVNTNLAFNEQSNIISSIEEKIEQYVKYYVDNNPTILSLHNVFEDWQTIAKNYSQTNNTFITKSNSSISGFFPKLDSDDGIGVIIQNHKHYGFSDKVFPIDNRGTIVFGSIDWYYKLLSQTITTSTSNPLTSGYIPTDSSIPTAVFLQDTYKNCLWFGYKGSGAQANTKRFASIFKNENNELVLKTDSGNIESEYSELLIHRNYMMFKKLVEFLADLHLTGNLEQGGNIKQPFIRTGMYTATKDANTIELGVLSESGSVVSGSITRNCSDIEKYDAYKGLVLVTDSNGVLLKTYTIEKSGVTVTTDLNDIQTTPNSSQTVLTSNYFSYLAQKINNVCRYIIKNYWRKDQYETGEIPGLKVSGNLEAGKNLKVGNNITSPLLSTNTESNIVTVGNTNTTKVDNSTIIQLPNFKNNILIVDEGGNISKEYFLETTTMNEGDLDKSNAMEPVTVIPEDPTRLVTSNYIKFILTKINNMCAWSNENVWDKGDFENGGIPDLVLQNNITIGKDIISPMIKTDYTKNTVTIGKDDGTGLFQVNQDTIKFPRYINNVLVTGADGTISHEYSMETDIMNDSDLPAETLIRTMPLPDMRRVVTAQHINWLCLKINNIINTTIGSGGSGESGTGIYWRKDQFPTGIIPGLKVSEYLQSLKAIFVGNESAPMFSADTDTKEVNIGVKTDDASVTKLNSNTIHTTRYQNNVLVTDGDGKIIKTYSIENMPINSDIEKIPGSTTDTIPDIAFPTDENKVVTSNYLGMLWRVINNIKARLKDTFNQKESRLAMYDHLQVGSIIEWSMASSDLLESSGGDIEPKQKASDPSIPKGWVICDGRTIPGTQIGTPVMSGCFTRTVDANTAITLANQYGGSPTITVPLTALPNHTHTGSIVNNNSDQRIVTDNEDELLPGKGGGWHIHSLNNIGFKKGSGTGGSRNALAKTTEAYDGKPEGQDKNDLSSGSYTDTRLYGADTPMNGFDVYGNQSSISGRNIIDKNAGKHQHSFKLEKKFFDKLKVSIDNEGQGQPFDHQPQYVMVYKIMKYKVDI